MSFKSKILYFLKKRIALLNRKKYVKNHYDSYSGTNISIISCNCIGGLIYHDLKEKFRSPTVNLYIESPDFIKFCSNLEHYLSIDKMYFKNNTSYPIGILDDIKIHFLHYHDKDEAMYSWNRRKRRVDYDKIYIIFTDRDKFNLNLLDEFYKLNYKKVFFSHKNYPLDDLVYIKESDKQNMVLDLTKYSNCNGEKYYEKYFDFNKWINTGLPTASCLKGKNRLTLYVVTDNESEYLPVGRVFIGVKNKKIRNVLIYDDNQDNISSKNSYFYELTALYWIWKNDKVSKIIGLEQNNRFFGAKSFMSIHSPLKYEKVYKILSKYDVIGSKNACFNNRYDNQYAKYLEDCRKVISEIYPNYDKSFSKIINYNVAYRYNMFIMSKLNLDRYCEWLFKILFTLEKRIGIKNDNNQEHIFCYLSEKLFNVWIYHNKIKVYESPTYMYN